MFDRLEDLLIRFEELMGELQSPGVTDNQTRFRALMKEQSDLAPIVDAYKEYKKAKEKKIKISVDIDTQKRNIYGDEYAFAEVIEIILDNAIKFTPTPKGKIEIKVFHPDTETLENNEMKSPMGREK